MAKVKPQAGLKKPNPPSPKKGVGNAPKKGKGLKVNDIAKKLFKRKPVGKA